MSRSYKLQTHQQHAAQSIDFESELNQQQLAAVTCPGGASLVIAGAGSGKTRTLTYRVAHLLSRGIPPRGILLLTFTNKAAREMLERVADLIPGRSQGIWGGTFHSVGNRVLRRHAEKIGFRQGFTILDRQDAEELIEAVVAKEGFASGDRRFPKGSVLADLFSLSVNTGAPIRSLLGQRYTYHIPLAEQIEQVQIGYENRKKEANSMDFDDLLSKTLELFATSEEVADQFQFQHVLVDEYQDTNWIQADLVDRFARRHGNITVVGDDAQSIYSWRGANFENILRFSERYPDARVFKIETNYRSVPGVLEVANAAIQGNLRQFPKNLAATRAEYPVKPALVPLSTNNEQASFVAQRILELHEEEGIPLDEIAILYRAHFHSLEVQLELTRRNIPFAITSGLRFFEQAHIKDVSCFLKLAVNPCDEISFKRIVRLLPGIGLKSAESLWERASGILAGKPAFDALLGLKVPAKAAKDWDQLVHTLAELCPEGQPQEPSAMINSVLFALYEDVMKQKFSNFEQRKEDLSTLSAFAGQFENTEDFLSQIALLASAETTEAMAGSQEAGKVTLSTIHQAKGLEWRVVFLIWLTEGMFPHSRSMDSDKDLEEERRLFYVGVTRCKDDLYLSYPDIRLNTSYGESLQRPSRFLSEIPESLLEAWEVSSGSGFDDEPF